MLHGVHLTFHKDGTGTIKRWGGLALPLSEDEEQDPEFEEIRRQLAEYGRLRGDDPAFQWRAVGDMKIEITHEGEKQEVSYDFKDDKNEYRIPELRMYELGREPDEYREGGFWGHPYSLVYHGRTEDDGLLNRVMRCFFFWW